MTFLDELNELHDPQFLAQNWDGYDSDPLKPEAFTRCESLYRQWALHSDFPLPDPCPVPCNDGNIALEWDEGGKEDRRMLSVVPQGRGVVYAFLKKNGSEYTEHGKVEWTDEKRLERLRQLTREFCQKVTP